MDERAALVALNLVPGLGPLRIDALCRRFGSASGAWQAGPRLWSGVAGIGPVTIAQAHSCAPTAGQREIEQAAARGIRVLVAGDPEYPPLLGHMPARPPVLYVRGLLPAQPLLALVGSRRATPVGLRVAEDLAAELAELGAAIVSGLARGIDTAAHRGALRSRGRTVGVFGCGLDTVYPPENAALCSQILAEGGALVSEFPLGVKPRPQYFPRRNRIIAGLAEGVVVVEAGPASGALITAAHAADLGREVFAVPGDITRWNSAGPNQLIRDGAKLVRSARDVLEEFSWGRHRLSSLPESDTHPGGVPPRDAGMADADPHVVAVAAALADGGPLPVDELVGLTRLPAPRVLAVLTQLETAGWVRRYPGQTYALVAGRFTNRRGRGYN